MLPPGRAAAFNQAMMELGATVCTPRAAGLRPLPGGRPAARARAAARRRAARRTGATPRFEDTDR